MPGWVNIAVKIGTYEHIRAAKNGKSFDKFLTELLEPKDCSTCNNQDACNIIHEFLSNERAHYCSEYRKNQS